MNHKQQSLIEKTQEPPWYRQFWPWFIIALPASAVIASLITLYLAVSRPDYVVIEDEEYRQLKSELKAQAPAQENTSQQDDSDKPDPSSN
jgi:hypothetical protein